MLINKLFINVFVNVIFMEQYIVKEKRNISVSSQTLEFDLAELCHVTCMVFLL